MNKYTLNTVFAFDYYEAIKTKDFKKIGGIDCFHNIQIEKYNEFELSDLEKQVNRLEYGKLFNQLDMIINDDRFQLNLIERKDSELNQIKIRVAENKSTFGKQCAVLRKSGFQFDTLKITLFDFLYNLKVLESEKKQKIDG